MTDVLAAGALGVSLHGVGPGFFTNALTTELRLLSQKEIFSVAEIYLKIYSRTQFYIASGIADEPYPAPIHLELGSDESSHRRIVLSVQRQAGAAEMAPFEPIGPHDLP